MSNVSHNILPLCKRYGSHDAAISPRLGDAMVSDPDRLWCW